LIWCIDVAGSIKYKQVSGDAHGGGYTQCRPTKQHVLDYAVAQRLHQGGIAGLLPFSFTDEGARPELFYFTDGLLALHQAMDSGFSFSQIYALFKGAIATLETCVSLGMPTQNIDFDPLRVLVRPVDIQPMFIYLPLQNYQPGSYDVRSLLLLVVSQGKPASEVEQAQMTSLLSHLKQQSLFSLIELKDFLGLGDRRGVPISGRLTTGSQIARPLRRVRDFVSENTGVDRSESGASVSLNATSSSGSGPGPCAALGSYALVRVSDNTIWRINSAALVLGRVGDGQTLKVSDSPTVGRAHAHLFVQHGRCYFADND
jgi:hypothetical protein